MYDDNRLYNFCAVFGAAVIFLLLCGAIFFVAMSLLG